MVPGAHSVPSKRTSSSSGSANRFESGSCPAARMFTAKTPPSAMTSCVVESALVQMRTRGGSADTLAKAETVIPWIRDPLRAVTMVTPDAHRRRTCLNCSGSTGMVGRPGALA